MSKNTNEEIKQNNFSTLHSMHHQKDYITIKYMMYSYGVCMVRKTTIIYGLVAAIIIVSLLSGCVQKPIESQNQKVESSELSNKIDEINSLANDFNNLNNNVSNLNESEDLSQEIKND